jgi:starch-binding outer membrane protein, SusD/RagB family
VVNGTGYATKKWTISAENGQEVEQNFPWHTSANFAIYRYAEVLLLYAEVLNELGRQDDAIDYINMVRARPSVDMPPVASGLSYDQVFEAIRHERRVELAFEGKTGIDLRRWGIADDFLRSPDRWQNDININPQWGGNFFKFQDGIHDILPIPQAEIDKSQGTLEQNSGY